MNELYNICKEFIEENRISSVETIYQCDHVIMNALELIEAICEEVGFYDNPDLDKLIRDGLNKAVIYDSDAYRLTKRLICLMKTASNRAGIEPNNIFIGETAYKMVLSDWMEFTKSESDYQLKFKTSVCRLLGMTVHVVDGLDKNDSESYYRGLIAGLGGENTMKNIVIVTDDKMENCILGTY